jgi:hypothetical protein
MRRGKTSVVDQKTFFKDIQELAKKHGARGSNTNRAELPNAALVVFIYRTRHNNHFDASYAVTFQGEEEMPVEVAEGAISAAQHWIDDTVQDAKTMELTRKYTT